jgi:hypothetical protein
MAAFTDQVTQCCDRGCGVPLKFKGHQDVAEIYDCTPSILPLTIGPLARVVSTEVHTAPPARTRETTDYQRLRSTETPM